MGDLGEDKLTSRSWWEIWGKINWPLGVGGRSGGKDKLATRCWWEIWGKINWPLGVGGRSGGR